MSSLGMASYKCLNLKCGKFAKIRGLCHCHYYALRDRINKGKLTWKKAEDKKMCLPVKKKKKFAQTWLEMYQ